MANFDEILASIRGTYDQGVSDTMGAKKGVLSEAGARVIPTLDIGGISGKSGTKGKGGSSPDGGDPLWMDILNFIARPQRAITGMFAEGSSDGSSFGSTLASGWKGLTGQEKRDFDEAMSNWGWKDEKGFGAHDVVSFLGDVGLDPLTYLTLGAGSAVKAGSKAAQNTAKQIAKEAGVKTGKNVFTDTADNIAQATKAKYADNANINQDLISRLAKKKSDDAAKKINDAAKAAREQAQNALLNFDVPFTKITSQIGRKPAQLQKAEAALGQLGANAVVNALNKLGLKTADQQKMVSEIQKRYGVDSLDKLNIQQLQDLQDQLGKAPNIKNLPDFNVEEILSKSTRPVNGAPTQGIVTDASQLFDGVIPNEVLTALRGADDPLALGNGLPKAVDDLISAGRSTRSSAARNVVDAEEVVEQLTRNVTPKDARELSADDILKQFDSGFVQDMGGKSSIGKKVSEKLRLGYLNPRTLRSQDALVNNSAEYMRDADSQIFGQTRLMEKQLGNLQKASKKAGLTEAELKNIPFMIENAFPGGAKKDDFLANVPAEKRTAMEQLASDMKGILDTIGQQETRDGVLGTLRQGYFPHVVSGKSTLDPKRLEELKKSDPEFASLVGKSQGNVFAKRRETYQNLAQVDNYVLELDQKIEAADLAGNADLVRELEDKKKVVQELFERDPYKALGKRYAKSIRSRAMKKMYDNFKKDGLLAVGKMSDESFVNHTHGLQELDSAQIKLMGLDVKPGEKVYMHPEVLAGMKKIDSFFTDEGANKFLDTLTTVQNIWKSLVTSFVPSHHVGNLIGNIANNALAGVKPTAYQESMSILNAARLGRLTPKQQKLFDEAMDNGVINQGYIADFTRSPDELANPKGMLKKTEQFVRNKMPLVKPMIKGGETVENWTRMALYVHARNTTGSAKLASKEVRKYLFNYHELTDTDRAIKAFAPFWTWTKNNLPLQIEQFLTQPRYYQTYLRLKEDMQGDLDDSDIPKWMRESYLRVGEKTFYNPRLPLSQLNDVDNPLGVLTNLIGPMYKMPLELNANQNFFTGNPIDYEKKYSGEGYSADDIRNYLLSQLGVVDKAWDIAQTKEGENNWLDVLAPLIGKPTQLRD